MFPMFEYDTASLKPGFEDGLLSAQFWSSLLPLFLTKSFNNLIWKQVPVLAYNENVVIAS